MADDGGTRPEGDEHVVSVRVLWGDAQLRVAHVRAGRAFLVGPGELDLETDFAVSLETLGASHVPLVDFRGGEALVVAPPHARVSLELHGERAMSLEDALAGGLARASGRVAGGHELTLSRGARVQISLPPPARASGYRDAGLEECAASATIRFELLHERAERGVGRGIGLDRRLATCILATAFVVLGPASLVNLLIVPSDFGNEDDGPNRDQLYAIQVALQSAEEGEHRRMEEAGPDPPPPEDTKEGGTVGRQAAIVDVRIHYEARTHSNEYTSFGELLAMGPGPWGANCALGLGYDSDPVLSRWVSWDWDRSTSHLCRVPVILWGLGASEGPSSLSRALWLADFVGAEAPNRGFELDANGQWLYPEEPPPPQPGMIQPEIARASAAGLDVLVAARYAGEAPSESAMREIADERPRFRACYLLGLRDQDLFQGSRRVEPVELDVLSVGGAEVHALARPAGHTGASPLTAADGSPMRVARCIAAAIDGLELRHGPKPGQVHRYELAFVRRAHPKP